MNKKHFALLPFFFSICIQAAETEHGTLISSDFLVRTAHCSAYYKDVDGRPVYTFTPNNEFKETHKSILRYSDEGHLEIKHNIGTLSMVESDPAFVGKIYARAQALRSNPKQ